MQVESRWLVKWDGADSVVSFDVWYKKVPTGGYPFGAVASPPWKEQVTSKKAHFTAQAGATYCFSVMGWDADGKHSGLGQACTTMPHRAKKLARGSGWEVESASGYYGNGYLRWNGSSGLSPLGSGLRAALRGPVDGLPERTCLVGLPPDNCEDWEYPVPPYLKRIVLVATQCPNCGRVRVTVHGRNPSYAEPLAPYPVMLTKNIDLTGSRFHRKQLFTVKTYTNPLGSDFKGWFVRITPTAGHPRIEGIALSGI